MGVNNPADSVTLILNNGVYVGSPSIKVDSISNNPGAVLS